MNYLSLSLKILSEPIPVITTWTSILQFYKLDSAIVKNLASLRDLCPALSLFEAYTHNFKLRPNSRHSKLPNHAD